MRYRGMKGLSFRADIQGLTGPHGIAVDAFGGDPIAASACDGILKAQDDDTTGHAHGHEESEQEPTGGERRPDGAMQATMIRRKSGATRRPTSGAWPPRSALTRSEDSAGPEDFDLRPQGSSKDWRKDTNGTAKGRSARKA